MVGVSRLSAWWVCQDWVHGGCVKTECMVGVSRLGAWWVCQDWVHGGCVKTECMVGVSRLSVKCYTLVVTLR